jgi:hypothetical protein
VRAMRGYQDEVAGSCLVIKRVILLEFLDNLKLTCGGRFEWESRPVSHQPLCSGRVALAGNK